MSKADISPTPIRSRRAVLAGIASAAVLPIAAAVPTAPTLPAEAATDPIFAALEAFRSADAEFYADWDGNIPDAIGDRRWQAADDVIRTQPTTPAGLGALTSFARDMAERSNRGDAGFADGQWVPVVAAIDDATRGMSGLKPWSPADGQSNTQADPVIAMAERAIAAWNDFEAKCSVTSKAEETVIDWRNLNPQPEHKTALKEWGAKKRLVEKESGYTRAEAVQQRASGRFGDLRDELVYARPISVAGLRAKAHAARTSSDEDLQQQIVFDIGVLFGDLDSNEEPIAAGLGKGGQS